MALKSCPECGAPVSRKAPACPKCGHPIGGVARGGPGCLARLVKGVVVLGVLGVVGVIVLASLAPTRPPASAPSGRPASRAPKTFQVGELATLGYADGGGKFVWICADGDDWNAFLDAENAAAAGRAGPLAKLIAEERAHQLPVGTPVMVMETAILSMRVDVTEGDFMGLSGWIQREQVQPLP